MAANPLKIKWTKLDEWACRATTVPGGVLLHSEAEVVYGGRVAICLLPMDDATADAWIKANKEKDK